MNLSSLSNGVIEKILQQELRRFEKELKADDPRVFSSPNGKIKLYCTINGSAYGQLSGWFGVFIYLTEVELIIKPFIEANNENILPEFYSLKLDELYYKDTADHLNRDLVYGLVVEREMPAVLNYFKEFENIARSHILLESRSLLEYVNCEMFIRKFTNNYEQPGIFHTYKGVGLGRIVTQAGYEFRILTIAYLANVSDLENIYTRLKRLIDDGVENGLERFKNMHRHIDELYNQLKRNAVRIQ